MTEKPIPEFIRRRCPGASEAELRDAYDRFRAYLELAYRIYERCSAPAPDSRSSDSFARFDDKADPHGQSAKV